MVANYSFPEDDRIDRIIKGLEDRIADLERLARSKAAAIDDGALEVRKDGQTVIRLGELANGSYGIEMLAGGALTVVQGGSPKVKLGQLDNGEYGMALYNQAGQALPLSQLAFGIKATKNDGVIVPARNAWIDDSAMAQTLTVTTGRVIVILSAQITAGVAGTGTRTTGLYGYRLIGPTVVSAHPGRAFYGEYTGIGQESTYQGTWVDVQEGLAPGNYTVVPVMLNDSQGSPGNDSAFAYRRLTVLPY